MTLQPLRRSATRLATAALVLGAFATGIVVEQRRHTATPSVDAAGLYADWCIYSISDHYDTTFGNYKVISAAAGNYPSRYSSGYIPDYQARNAVGSFDCERTY